MIRDYADIGDRECRRNMARYAVLRGYDNSVVYFRHAYEAVHVT
jgi:hypothetical protein